MKVRRSTTLRGFSNRCSSESACSHGSTRTSAVLRAGTADLAPQFPRLAAALKACGPGRRFLDGIVTSAEGTTAVLYLFDILYAEEWDLRRLPLRERKIVLRSLLPESARAPRVDPVAERGRHLQRRQARTVFPAIIAKKADSPYKAGASADWRVIRVTASSAAKRPAKSRAARAAAPTTSGITVTHPGKVYWPEQGYTKADLVRYYDRAANWLLPYLKDRPLHLYRWPDGIRGKSFYQKQLPPELLDRLRDRRRRRVTARSRLLYAMCNDRKALMTLINAGSIDLHPWLSREGQPRLPRLGDPRPGPEGGAIQPA